MTKALRKNVHRGLELCFLKHFPKNCGVVQFPFVLQVHSSFPASLRSLKSLEDAVQILEDQFEKIEEVKADVSELLTADIEPKRKSQ